MTIEEKATTYIESFDTRIFGCEEILESYMPDMKDNYAEKDMYFDIAILLEGEFINLDAVIVRPTYWMPIPIPPLKASSFDETDK